MWDKLKEQFNLLKLERKKLFLITNSSEFETKNDFIDAVASALQGGVDIIMLKESMPDSALVQIGRKIRVLCDEFGATFLVHNRADIAKLTEADGVHLERDAISMKDVKSILSNNVIIGRTAHNSEEIKKSIEEKADYIIVEPDKNFLLEEEQDNVSIEEIIKNNQIPAFFCGNININNIEEFVRETNIHKIVLKDEIMYAKVPEQTARKILTYL